MSNINNQVITYTDPATQTIVSDILFWQDTIWMTQDQMSKLYNKVPSGISMHIQKIYQDGELKEAETSQSESKFRNTENTGLKTENSFKKPKKYYNLQIVIAVGFKVNSPQATSFRTWANTIIQQYIEHGYVLNDERLKGGKTFGGKRDYDALMTRIRAIKKNPTFVESNFHGATGWHPFEHIGIYLIVFKERMTLSEG